MLDPSFAEAFKIILDKIKDPIALDKQNDNFEERKMASNDNNQNDLIQTKTVKESGTKKQKPPVRRSRRIQQK